MCMCCTEDGVKQGLARDGKYIFQHMYKRGLLHDTQVIWYSREVPFPARQSKIYFQQSNQVFTILI